MKCSNCFVSVLVSVASIWNISAHDIHRDQLGGNATVTPVNVVSTIKGQDIHETVSPPTATKEDKGIGGRKMAVEYKVVRLEMGVEVAVDGVSGRSSNSKTASRSSSNLEGKSSCRSHEGNVKCRQSSSASRFNSEKGADDRDHEYAGFVAFSRDYPSPRHHPPKNN